MRTSLVVSSEVRKRSASTSYAHFPPDRIKFSAWTSNVLESSAHGSRRPYPHYPLALMHSTRPRSSTISTLTGLAPGKKRIFARRPGMNFCSFFLRGCRATLAMMSPLFANCHPATISAPPMPSIRFNGNANIFSILRELRNARDAGLSPHRTPHGCTRFVDRGLRDFQRALLPVRPVKQASRPTDIHRNRSTEACGRSLERARRRRPGRRGRSR